MNTNKKVYSEIFLVLAIISMPLIHEFGHFLAYSIEGIKVTFTYAFANSERQTLLGVLGGPLINVLIGVISIALIKIDNKRKDIYGSIGLASLISRLVSCIIIFLIGIIGNNRVLDGNDEGRIAYFLGTNTIFQYIILIIIYLFLTLTIAKLSKNWNKLIKTVIYTLILTVVIVISQII